MIDPSKWNRLFANQPAFILGTGPSIEDIDLSMLNGFYTIGVNRIFLKYDPTCIFWQDISLWNDHARKLDNLECIKIPAYCSKTHTSLPDHEGQYYVKSRTVYVKHSTSTSACVSDDYLTFIRSKNVSASGIMAVQLAIMLGCSPIVLVGIDGDYSGNKTNFYGVCEHHDKKTLSIYRKSMLWLQKVYTLPIINCGKSLMWPHRNFYSIVGTLDRNKKKADYHKNKLCGLNNAFTGN
ncbi:MAG: hypothetical protein QQN41_08185 [Nitrosopumilus sp.]